MHAAGDMAAGLQARNAGLDMHRAGRTIDQTAALESACMSGIHCGHAETRLIDFADTVLHALSLSRDKPALYRQRAAKAPHAGMVSF